jgi:hypothetical protein
MEMASTYEGAPTDFHNPAAILAKSPMAVKEKARFTNRYFATYATLGASKPCNSLSHRFVGDSEPPGDRQAAHAKLLKSKGLRRDLLVDRRGARF